MAVVTIIYVFEGAETPTKFIDTVFDIAFKAWIEAGHSEETYGYTYVTPKEAQKLANWKTTIKTDSVIVYSTEKINGTNYIYLKGVGTPDKWKAAFLDIFKKVIPSSDGTTDESGVNENGNGGNGGNGFGLGLNLPDWVWLIGAGLGTVKAVEANNKAGQLLWGSGAAYCLYEYFSKKKV